MSRKSDFENLASLFTYPWERYDRSARLVADELGTRSPEVRQALRAFADEIAGKSPEHLQELFVRTFELNPACCLEVGWQLFGDHYERGSFLVHMRSLLNRFRIPETAELPDHLSHALRILAHMGEQEAAQFVAERLGGAVAKMHDSLASTDNPYRHLLAAVQAMLAVVNDTASAGVRHA